MLRFLVLKPEGVSFLLFKQSKINAFRTWGLFLTLAGMSLMILGTAGVLIWGENGKILLSIALFIGLIVMLGSVAIYFWAGMLSTSAVSLECPECGKQTKILGKTDRCMFCKTILTFDPNFSNQNQ